MFYGFIIIKVFLLIYVTSAEFNLNSLITANKSLDTFNQTKITLNTSWDYYNKDDETDPITYNEQPQVEKVLKEIAPAAAAAAETAINTKYLTRNQKLLKIESNEKLSTINANQNSNFNYFMDHYTTTTRRTKADDKFDKRYNQDNNNQDNFNLNNMKLKAITRGREEQLDDDDNINDEVVLKGIRQFKRVGGVDIKDIVVEKKMRLGKLQRNYYKPFALAAFDSSSVWLGQLPQFQLQPQKLQLFLQQPQRQQQEHHTTSSSTSSSKEAEPEEPSFLPQEYHHLSDYRFLFNVERHTEFQLHTLVKQEQQQEQEQQQQSDYVGDATKQATTTTTTAAAASTATLTLLQQENVAHNNKQQQQDDNDDDNDEEAYNYFYDNDEVDEDNPSDKDNNNDYNEEKESYERTSLVNLTNSRVLNYVTDTVSSVLFGANSRPVAGIEGIHHHHHHTEHLELYNGLSLRQSRFNPFNPCRILIHGWLGGSHATFYNALIPEYFKLHQGSYNIITVDWGKGAIADYITASYRVKLVGMLVAKFIDFLHSETAIPFSQIHVIGFSMGAHIAGIAGKFVQTGRLPVILGLDPALPLFRYENVQERLDRRDADYVEVIHTSVGSYGYDHPLGHVDFYVNYGYNQPGCFFNECSHFRSFKVYAQILANEDLSGEECLGRLWLDMIKHKRCLEKGDGILKMGVEGLKKEEVSKRRGLYFVNTNAQPPYRMG